MVPPLSLSSQHSGTLGASDIECSVAESANLDFGLGARGWAPIQAWAIGGGLTLNTLIGGYPPPRNDPTWYFLDPKKKHLGRGVTYISAIFPRAF